MKVMRILVPRFLDRDNHNAQNLNTKALLSRFASKECNWFGAHYGDPDPAVLANTQVKLISLWRRNLWPLRLWLFYLQPADALFYPGREAVDAAGMRWRKRLYPRSPVIATMEGLAGTEAREKQLTEWAGHRVFCQRIERRTMDRIDAILGGADHIIAISPFLARMGRKLYGHKFSVLPLGIDLSNCYPSVRKGSERVRVVSAGTFQPRKRPEMFLELARRHPQADFTWYGDGESRIDLQAQADRLGIANLGFPGTLPPSGLADAFRAADIFVMPSISEGVPKVTQEAAACGLPVILMGYYEAPSVVDGENGFVAWDDKELFDRVSMLLASPDLRAKMGENGAARSAALSWDIVAPQWETAIKDAVSRFMR